VANSEQAKDQQQGQRKSEQSSRENALGASLFQAGF
jgi:hypothetical protein